MQAPEIVPVAFVSGANGEIGNAILERLAADGFRTVGGWRSEAPPIERHLRCDVTDEEAVESAIATTEERWGPIEVVVANAGFAHLDLAIRARPDAFRSVIETSLTGAHLVAAAALRRMVRRRSGRVVLIGSTAATHGVPGMASYGAAKAGLEGLARSLAREVGRRSITVNVVAPGMLSVGAGRLAAARPDGRIEEAWVAATPLARTGRASDVAAMVSFLASPAGAAITGATVAVDGGFAIGLG